MKSTDRKLQFPVDTELHSFYSAAMRFLASLLLVAVLIGLVVPPTLSVTLAGGGAVEVGLLDVCHQAAPALAANGDMPCINESPCMLSPTLFVIAFTYIDPVSIPLLIPSQNDRPPQA